MSSSSYPEQLVHPMEGKVKIFTECLEKQFNIHRSASDAVHEAWSGTSYLDVNITMLPKLHMLSGSYCAIFKSTSCPNSCLYSMVSTTPSSDHFTIIQLNRVVIHLSSAVNMNLSKEAVLLDVSQAFDQIWHKGLLYNLTLSLIPSSIVNFLGSYLSDCTFKVNLTGPALYIFYWLRISPRIMYMNDLTVYAGVTL